MIDIHSHILPGIDDGSQSVEESLKILEAMKESGIEKVVATPHFYCETMSVEDFLKNRQSAFEKIKDIKPEGIDVILGAEVMLSYDLYKEELRELAIEGTDYILIEMPYGKWDPWVFDEIFKISSKHQLEVIIAHIDRYTEIVTKSELERLFKMSLKYQVNVDFLGGFLKKSPAMRLLKNDAVHFIASDCHNLTSRPPCLEEAVKRITAKLGRECVDFCMNNARRVLENKSI